MKIWYHDLVLCDFIWNYLSVENDDRAAVEVILQVSRAVEPAPPQATAPPTTPPRKLCVATGQPAAYKDPNSVLNYASIAAYQV